MSSSRSTHVVIRAAFGAAAARARTSTAARCASVIARVDNSSAEHACLSQVGATYPCRRQDRRALSSNSAADNDEGKVLTLRRLSAPFLLVCHPDKIPSSSPSLREVNLRATQTLNGLIDTVEELCNRASVGGATGSPRAGRVELDARYEVEFLVPSSEAADGESSVGIASATRRKSKRRGDDGRTYTRRSIIIRFPRSLRDGVQTVDSSGRYSVSAAILLRQRTGQEIIRLLKVAGAAIPDGAGDMFQRDYKEDINSGSMGRDRGYGNDDALMEEMDLDGSTVESYLGRSRFGGGGMGATRRPMNPYEKSRRKFMDSIDWAQHRRRTEEALRDAEADLATQRMLGGSQERRERLISTILSRVTIDSQERGAEDDNDGSHTDDGMTESGAAQDNGLDPIHQLIAFRRLSLLLADSYDHLQMETMGKLWDNTSIVLTPSRRENSFHRKDDSGQTIVESSAAFGIPRRRNPLIEGQESGFKFTYGSDGGITVYIPIDFTDEELILQLSAHVWDFYNISGDGLEDLYPKYMQNVN